MSTDIVQTNGQAPAPPKTKMEILKNVLSAESIQQQFGNALKENRDAFVASVIELYSGDTYLQNCEPKLVVMEALKAAVLKLAINKSLGHAYIIPYKKNNVLVPQFQIGYKGLVQLAIRTNQYKFLHADVVFDGEFKTSNKLTGEFDLTGTKKSDTIIGYFAHFQTLQGFSKTLFMTKERVTKHAQKYSKSYAQEYSPWKTEFDAMATKTVLRGLLSHWGLLSIEMANALDSEGDVEEKVDKEIRANANVKPMQFEQVQEAEMQMSENGGGPDY